MQWTKEQQQVIEARNSNLLVAAAAGSGKTAVLVERIIQMVTDEKTPIDIDALLVVTFTNAAASQMREKINKALSEKQEECPTNAHLTKQLSLLHRANIMTIDSFCLKIVKEHFHLLGLDPNFRIGDEGELATIRTDVLNKVLEAYYEKKEPAFMDFAACFGGDKTDVPLEKYILHVASVAESYPRPMVWLKQAREALQIKSMEDLETRKWYQDMLAIVKSSVQTCIEDARYGIALCNRPNGPSVLVDTLLEDIQVMEGVLHAKGYDALNDAFGEKFPRAKTVKKDTADEVLTERVKKLRDYYKKTFSSLNRFDVMPDQLLEDIDNVSRHMQVLISITETYMQELLREKKRQNLLDFSDIEHFALELLVNENGITDVAKQLQSQFFEILIDEYQDSNFLQEEILTSISGISNQNHNMFMVGDVKQSIYKFRMARPDLFMGKYDTYTVYEQAVNDPEKKIELHNNFRSRAVVLEAVNYVFYQIMGMDIGGIQYDEWAKLIPEFPFPESEGCNISDSTELMVLDVVREEDEEESEERQEYSNQELEARMIAGRILELVGQTGNQPLYVLDEDCKHYRKAAFRDIAILLRSTSTTAAIYTRVLSELGIPVVSELRSGFLETIEIHTLLACLTVIDNPYNDIELATVLHSEMFGITSSEMAQIRLFADKKDRKMLFYDAAFYYHAECKDNAQLTEKLEIFFEFLNSMKDKMQYLDVCQLIWDILKETKYLVYLKSMQNGERRVANVNYLIDLAKKYGDSGRNSIFDFVHYISQMKKANLDMGEANVVGEQDDIVRIMTMHKSKGLEFPIVFVSGLGKKMNQRDTSESIVVHSDHYLSSIYADSSSRHKHSTFMKEAFSDIMKLENIAEEFRVLYVAMTRAKEKMILTGHVKGFAEMIERYENIAENANTLLSFGYRKNADSFMNLLLLSLMRNRQFHKAVTVDLAEQPGIVGCQYRLEQELPAEFNLQVSVCRENDLFRQQAELGVNRLLDIAKYASIQQEKCDADLLQLVQSRLDYQYPHQWMVDKKANYTVTELKGDDKENTIPILGTPPAENKKHIPRFMQEQEAITGASKGSIMHKIMELLDFSMCQDAEWVRNQITSWVQAGILPEQTLQYVEIEEILLFFQSEIGCRMMAAAKKGSLIKEKPFLITMPLSAVGEVENEALLTEEDCVLLQGIIDAYFVDTDGEIVVVDYKSDRKNLPLEPYVKQISMYADCLERLTHRKVKERYIYAFALQKAIKV